MRLKRILTSTLSVLLLTGFLVTTPAKAAPGSAFANNSKEYQELKQLAQSFQRGGSCYIDDYEAEGALEYVENALYDGFDSQEKFNSGMKQSYSYLLYDCQTMAKQPKETQPEKPKETQPEKPKETQPEKPKQESNVSSKPKPNNSTPKKTNNTSTKPSQSNTTTKPKQNSTSSKPKSTQSTVSTTKTKPNNSNTVKETQTVVATAPKETVKETVVETPKETVKETELETTKETQLETKAELKETQKESDLIKKENTNKKYALVGGGILAISGIIAYIFYIVRKSKK